MGMSMDELAQLVLQLEPPFCPVCQAEGSIDTAAVNTVKDDEGNETAALVTYHCSECGSLVHTFV